MSLEINIDTEKDTHAVLTLLHEIEACHEALKAFRADMEDGIKITINPEKNDSDYFGFYK